MWPSRPSARRCPQLVRTQIADTVRYAASSGCREVFEEPLHRPVIR